MAKSKELSLSPVQREEIAEFVLRLAARFPDVARRYRAQLELPHMPPHLEHQAVYLENAAAFAKFVAYRIRTARIKEYPDPIPRQ